MVKIIKYLHLDTKVSFVVGRVVVMDSKLSLDPKHRTKNNQRWREKHRDKARAMARRYLYNITKEQAERMLEKQQGLCIICGQNPATDLDHDHDTNTVRDLLCGTCNRGLGCFKDNLDLLEKAFLYLKKWKSNAS